MNKFQAKLHLNIINSETVPTATSSRFPSHSLLLLWPAAPSSGKAFPGSLLCLPGTFFYCTTSWIFKSTSSPQVSDSIKFQVRSCHFSPFTWHLGGLRDISSNFWDANCALWDEDQNPLKLLFPIHQIWPFHLPISLRPWYAWEVCQYVLNLLSNLSLTLYTQTHPPTIPLKQLILRSETFQFY